MKKHILIAISFLMLLSCEKGTNYSELIKQQQKEIEGFISQNNIEVLKNYPKDSVFQINQYFRENPDSILFRLMEKGSGIAVKAGDRIQVRWVQYSLDGKDSISYWSVSDLSYPVEIIYEPTLIANETERGGRTNINCVGWQTAIRLMERSDAIADIVVPSPIGLMEAFNTIKAYRYKITFKILPK